ncbi:hypothetical protein HDU96_011098 [Phlyctochytrium bullatum]|nr:hypothetical protein HDU96_011098 [Phlyctochytrium bullatum]
MVWPVPRLLPGDAANGYTYARTANTDPCQGLAPGPVTAQLTGGQLNVEYVITAPHMGDYTGVLRWYYQSDNNNGAIGEVFNNCGSNTPQTKSDTTQLQRCDIVNDMACTGANGYRGWQQCATGFWYPKTCPQNTWCIQTKATNIAAKVPGEVQCGTADDFARANNGKLPSGGGGSTPNPSPNTPAPNAPAPSPNAPTPAPNPQPAPTPAPSPQAPAPQAPQPGGSSCTTNDMMCTGLNGNRGWAQCALNSPGTGPGLLQCANGNWVQKQCEAGRVCYPVGEANIACGFPNTRVASGAIGGHALDGVFSIDPVSGASTDVVPGLPIGGTANEPAVGIQGAFALAPSVDKSASGGALPAAVVPSVDNTISGREQLLLSIQHHIAAAFREQEQKQRQVIVGLGTSQGDNVNYDLPRARYGRREVGRR